MLAAVGLGETDQFVAQSKGYATAWTKAGFDGAFLGVPEVHHFNILTDLAFPDRALTVAALDHIRSAC
jgi:hypothetical protein